MKNHALAFFKQALCGDRNAVGKNVLVPFTSNPRIHKWQNEEKWLVGQAKKVTHINSLINETFHIKCFGIAF